MLIVKIDFNFLWCFGVTEEGAGEHQRAPGAGDEERQVRARLQADPQDPAQRQGQACHHRQQHSPAQVYTH